jgi:glycosyltransferase involved in cell wall biosynthesis
MKILQLSKKFPYPLKDGESLAISYLSKAYHQLGAEVSLLAMNTTKHPFSLHQVPEEYDQYAAIHSVRVDNHLRWQDAFRNLFTRASYHISRFESSAYAKKLESILRSNQFDIIQLETVYLAPYIPLIRSLTATPIVMRAHNVEYEIWERIAQNTSNPLKRTYLNLLTHRLRRYEVEQLSNYDLLLAITQRDLDHFRKKGYRGEAVHIPIGLDLDLYTPDWSSFQRPLSISFIGSLDWMPNLEGIAWFLDKVWPQVHRQFPEVELHIAGRNTPESFRQKYQTPQVRIHGEVEDARAFINQHSMMVVPLLSGSGMRAKILEGMALGKAVLTTRLGLEGIKADHQKTVLTADDPDEFLNAVEWATQHPTALEEVGRAARQQVASLYSNLTIAEVAIQKFQALKAASQPSVQKKKVW